MPGAAGACRRRCWTRVGARAARTQRRAARHAAFLRVRASSREMRCNAAPRSASRRASDLRIAQPPHCGPHPPRATLAPLCRHTSLRTPSPRAATPCFRLPPSRPHRTARKKLELPTTSGAERPRSLKHAVRPGFRPPCARASLARAGGGEVQPEEGRLVLRYAVPPTCTLPSLPCPRRLRLAPPAEVLPPTPLGARARAQRTLASARGSTRKGARATPTSRSAASRATKSTLS